MADKEEVLGRIKDLLARQRFAVLASLHDEDPYCTLVGFSETEDCKMIIFATMRETRKFANIVDHPNVSMLVDNRSNEVGDLKDAQAMTIIGLANEVPQELMATCLANYLEKHPYMRQFVSAPDCVLISVKVSKYILVNNFQNVIEYSVS